MTAANAHLCAPTACSIDQLFRNLLSRDHLARGLLNVNTDILHAGSRIRVWIAWRHVHSTAIRLGLCRPDGLTLLCKEPVDKHFGRVRVWRVVDQEDTEAIGVSQVR